MAFICDRRVTLMILRCFIPSESSFRLPLCNPLLRRDTRVRIPRFTHRYTRKLISSSLLHSVSLISPTDMWEWRVISALVQRLPSFLQGYLEVFDLVLTQAVSPNYSSPLLHVAFWSTLQHVAFRTKGSNISLLRASMLTVIHPQKTAKLLNMNVADF